ncbi:hypothetical protein SALBM311S_02071 [Streptomyces alboniger]
MTQGTQGKHMTPAPRLTHRHRRTNAPTARAVRRRHGWCAEDTTSVLRARPAHGRHDRCTPVRYGKRVHEARTCRIMAGMSANPHDALPIRLNVDDSDSPSDVVDALFLGRFATGEQPYSHAANIDRVRSGAPSCRPTPRYCAWPATTTAARRWPRATAGPC